MTGKSRSALLLFVGMTALMRAEDTRPRTPQGFVLHSGADVLQVEVAGDNVARVHVEVGGQVTPRTLVMDPALPQGGALPELQPGVLKDRTFSAPGIRVSVQQADGLRLRFCNGSGLCLQVLDVLRTAPQGELQLQANREEPLYGMRGLELVDHGGGLLRPQGATVGAGVQGDGGAPFFLTPHYGVLVDSDGGAFEAEGKSIRFKGSSRRDLEFYIAFGNPMAVVSTMMKLTGLPPMAPKWTMGFVNSQWGTSEADLLRVASQYREKQIPLDAFVLDFDWKAWGEDNYGEWRWNSTSGPGSVQPDLFPNGASGVFANEMAQRGIKLAGILKPRILLSPGDNPRTTTEAAAYADAHHLWCDGETPDKDYVTHRLAGNLDFEKPATRTWFWQHLQPSFAAGMVGWWNDEADASGRKDCNNFQFLSMARMLYDGQRSGSDLRVWSLNRNYYLGPTAMAMCCGRATSTRALPRWPTSADACWPR